MAFDSSLVPQFISSAREGLWQPLLQAPWNDWQGFWLPLVLGDRFMVLFFLPLLPILWLLPARHLRTGIIATSLVFLAFLFGVIYPFIWLGMCVGFYYLTERFAVEAKRTDVVRWGPSLAAILSIGGWYIGSMAFSLIGFARPTNNWLFENLPWIFPLSARADIWHEQPPQLFFSLFFLVQLNGIVIFTIRMMHYFSEIKRDTIPRAQRTLKNFIAFASFAPTLMQGPVERFADFQEQIEHCHAQRSGRDALIGLYRIGLGILKNFVCLLLLGPTLMVYIIDSGYYAAPARISSYLALLACIHLQVFFLYLHFSGYCDVAIGMGRLLGYRVAENFNQYWLATSMTDAWRRWHITFSFILRDYIFLPLARRRWNVVLALVITFVVCGAIHNLNVNYIAWGIVMGLMVAVNQKWTRWMRTLDRRPQRRLASLRRTWLKLQPLPRLCAWALTFNALGCSALILAGKPGWLVIWELIRRPLVGLGRLCGLS